MGLCLPLSLLPKFELKRRNSQHSQVSRLSPEPIRVGLPGGAGGGAEAKLIRFQGGEAGLGRNSAFTLQRSREGLHLHHDPEEENVQR